MSSELTVRQRLAPLVTASAATSRCLPGLIGELLRLCLADGSNVLAIDYRGYADSTGTPTQAGLITDARTAWDWVAKRVEAGGKNAAEQIVVAGHSLGTGVTSALSGQLADEGQLRSHRKEELTERHLSSRHHAHCAIHVHLRLACFVCLSASSRLRHPS